MATTTQKFRKGIAFYIITSQFTRINRKEAFIFLLIFVSPTFQCPQCNRPCTLKGVRKLFASVDEESQKVTCNLLGILLLSEELTRFLIWDIFVFRRFGHLRLNVLLLRRRQGFSVFYGLLNILQKRHNSVRSQFLVVLGWIMEQVFSFIFYYVQDAYWCKKEAEGHLKLSQLTEVCFVLYLLFYCIRCTKHLCWNSSLCFGAYCVANSSSHVFCELPLLFWVSHSDHNFVLPKFSISFHSFVVLFQTIIIIIALGRSYSRELCMIRCLPQAVFISLLCKFIDVSNLRM